MKIQPIPVLLASAMIAFGTCGLRAAAIDLSAQEFSPKDVRLLNGPFKDAMERDAKYLLKLDPDRLLSGFRSEAGAYQPGMFAAMMKDTQSERTDGRR